MMTSRLKRGRRRQVMEGHQSRWRVRSSAAFVVSPEALALHVLTVTLGLSVWVALGSLVLATQELGEHPVRRIAVGVGLLATCLLALLARVPLARLLRARPAVTVAVAMAQLTAAAVDGLLHSPYVAVTITSIGLAVVVARARTVWLCAALLAGGYTLAILVEHAPARLAANGDLGGVIGGVLGYGFAALMLLGLRRLVVRHVRDAPAALQALRLEAPALTPALSAAIRSGPRPLLEAAKEVPLRGTPLTPSEIRVVEALAAGWAPKELAREWGVALSTVRTHIRNAKRKTRARTLRELAAMASRPEWPHPNGERP
ncbi:MAG: LuxR C-terminal-related transcriptional regulator [Actinomycetota bacterium]|nr:LuxR C-terminal-related transcriptional regulator [Actinomycetota bacterium]